ncbi:hypothetical protein VNO80_17818 [Phaseolus coccineus]|uniref:Uncharacterized protein n=1 Tax=Phaseolus coccineus TaxID=3886 RepID=A0AAN9QYB0_PHACN
MRKLFCCKPSDNIIHCVCGTSESYSQYHSCSSRVDDSSNCSLHFPSFLAIVIILTFIRENALLYLYHPAYIRRNGSGLELKFVMLP